MSSIPNSPSHESDSDDEVSKEDRYVAVDEDGEEKEGEDPREEMEDKAGEEERYGLHRWTGERRKTVFGSLTITVSLKVTLLAICPVRFGARTRPSPFHIVSWPRSRDSGGGGGDDGTAESRNTRMCVRVCGVNEENCSRSILLDGTWSELADWL
ncbi:hypothetical protein TSMEX_003741, partial [Taenia solium]